MRTQSPPRRTGAPDPPAKPRDCARIEAALTAFREITDAVADDGDLQSLLELVTARTIELVSVNRCGVYLLDEDTGLYRGHLLRVGEALDHRIERLTCGVEADQFTREILTTRAPVVVSDARTDTRPIRSAMRMFDVRSVLGVPMVLRGKVVGILYLDEESVHRQFSDEDIRVAAVFANLAAIVVSNTQTTAELRTTVEAARKQNATLRRAAIAEHRLAALVLDGAGFDEIAQSVAQLTGKPCAIYGADGRRIGSGSPPGTASDPNLLEPSHCRSPEIAQALAALRPGTTSVIGPFCASGIGHRLLISPVTVRGDEWGRIVLSERGKRLTGFDAQVTRRAGTIIALEISAQRRATELHADSGEALLRDLISGASDQSSLHRRATLYGLPVDEPQVLCLLADQHGGAWTGTDPASIVRALPDDRAALAVAVPEGIALALSVPEEDPTSASRQIVDAVLTSIGTNGVVAAVSCAFSGAGGFSRAYHEARQVARCLRTFGAPDESRVLCGDELGAGSLFLASTTRADAEQFARHTLGPLFDPRDRSMRDLLATLAMFFASSRSVRETAEVIGVHENTIRYRLARIAELTGLDVAANVDHQLAGQLATLVLRLEGTLPRTGEPAAAAA